MVNRQLLNQLRVAFLTRPYFTDSSLSNYPQSLTASCVARTDFCGGAFTSKPIRAACFGQVCTGIRLDYGPYKPFYSINCYNSSYNLTPYLGFVRGPIQSFTMQYLNYPYSHINFSPFASHFNNKTFQLHF